MPSETIALVMSGGGARGAYQAGALHALTEISADVRSDNPFPIISGLSAGALNAGYFATGVDAPLKTAQQLRHIWESLNTNDVIRTDIYGTGRVAVKWLADLTLSTLRRDGRVRSLLSTTPLRAYLERHIAFDRIQKNIDRGALRALSITATDYATTQSISFIQGASSLPGWQRKRRISEPATIGVDHIMASAAIPLVFPAIKIDMRFFGDGCLRNTAPLSPAIRLGASKLMVIGVRQQTAVGEPQKPRTFHPSMIRTLGVILNSVLMDALDVDIDVLARINALTAAIPNNLAGPEQIRPVDFLWITPSQDIAAIAYEEAHHMPKLLRFLLGGMGSLKDASEMLSYLLFESPFCRRIAQIGYDDTMRRADEVRRFLAPA